MDSELKKKYSIFLADLNTGAESFLTLINHAFAPDFENLIMTSAELAKAAGVSEHEILNSVEKVDSFFLD